MPDPIDNEEEEQDVEVNALEMSDEDFLNQPEPTEPEAEPEFEEDKNEEEQETDDEEDESEGEEDSEKIPEGKSEEDPTDKDDEGKIDPDIDPNAPDDTDAKDNGKESKSSEETTKDIDYKAEHEKLFAPFRANGKDMSVGSIDDIRRLMEMGANYNKKMAGLKPNLKLLKMLENNDLLDESKLSYLIDLDKKNPGAINKMIKDSGIDPLDIDPEKDTEYKPNTYTVDDSQVELDGVLDEIRDTTTFQDTIDTISNKWDESSKKVLLEQPSIIRVINDHKGSGVYDQINQVVESERMLGRLQGLSDLEAYKQVGDAIQARGGFKGQTPKDPDTPATEEAPPKAKPKLEDPKLKSRKKAASAAKGVKTGGKKQADFNPLALSDEEFEKISASQYQ